jgi:hypothetical protein
MRLLLNWLLSAISLLIVSKVVPGFYVHGFKAALIAALVIRIGECHAGALPEAHYAATNAGDLGNLLVGHQCLDADVCLDAAGSRFRGPRLLGGVLGSHRALADQYGVEVADARGGTSLGLLTPVNRKAVDHGSTRIFHGCFFRGEATHDSCCNI